MTEGEWLACSVPAPMLGELRARLPRQVAKRKYRLFICGCCRLAPDLLLDAGCLHAVEVGERYADGAATAAERDAARWALDPSYWRHAGPSPSVLAQVAALAGVPTGDLRPAAEGVTSAVAELRTQARLGSPFRKDLAHEWKQFKVEERQLLCNLLRDIIGNPFWPLRMDANWLAWNSGTVVRMAEAIYEERRFEELPVLADALEEAGCRDEEILSHCRGPGPHAKGCFLVDALLGKS